MTAYATRAHVYQFGLPRGALGNPGRLVDSALSSNSIITLNEHSFETGDAVYFRAADGGALAAPIVAGTAYYAIKVSESSFQVSTTPTGGPITLTSNAVSMLVWADLPFDSLLEYYSRFVDGFLPAEAVPLAAPYPVTVIAIVATLVAKRIQFLSGMTSASMDEAEAGAAKQLERYAAGLPVRDKAATQPQTNLALVRFRPDNRLGIPLFAGQVTGSTGIIGGGGPVD
jgi:hypothetical protein